GIRPVLPQPPSGQSAGRLDLTPEPGDQRPRRARTASGRGRSAVCRYRTGASTALGWLPSGAADDRILAGPAEPAARPAALSPGRGCLGARTPGPVRGAPAYQRAFSQARAPRPATRPLAKQAVSR